MTTVLGFLDGSLGLGEMMCLGIIAVLLFGKRLPDVGRSLGKALAEFKKGLNEIHNEVNWSSPPAETHHASYEDDDHEPTAPRFELPDDAQPDEPGAQTTTETQHDPADRSA